MVEMEIDSNKTTDCSSLTQQSEIGTSSRVSDLEQVAIILIIHLSSLSLSLQVVTFLPEG